MSSKTLVERIEKLAVKLSGGWTVEPDQLTAILADVRELQDMLTEIVEADAKAVYELTCQGFPPEMAGPAMELANKARAILTKIGAIKGAGHGQG